LTGPPIRTIGLVMNTRTMAFRLSKQQLAARDALATALREKAASLNATITAFNEAIEPLSQPVMKALEDYHAVLDEARGLASGIADSAHDEFDTRSERWQSSDKGIIVRSWIEQWEVNLDDIELDLPEPLTEIDPDQHANEIEGAPPGPSE
jgi:hypothetical protein